MSFKSSSLQAGIVHLFSLLILGIVAIVTITLLLIYKGAIKNPVPNIIKIPTSSVELAPEYKNPLAKSSQYTNPFSSYKNPFDTLK